MGGLVLVWGGKEVDETVLEVDEGLEPAPVGVVVGDPGAKDGGGRTTTGRNDDGGRFGKVTVVVIVEGV